METGLVSDIDVEKSLFSQMLFSEDQSLIPGNIDTTTKKEKSRRESVSEIPLLIKVTFMLFSMMSYFLFPSTQ
jgi:hypothetical protein